MDIKELKKTWDRVPAGNPLDESQISGMVHKKAGHLIGRIDRNIRIGFVVLFLLITLFILDDFVFSPLLLDKLGTGLEIPGWLTFLSIFCNAFLLITFLFFTVQYYHVKRKGAINSHLRDTLVKIIRTLRIYQRLFYLALTVLFVAVAISFITGMVAGMTESLNGQGLLLEEIPAGRLALVIGTGLSVLGIIVGGLFFFLRWGFRRLYGNYIHKLKQTLRELEEEGMEE